MESTSIFPIPVRSRTEGVSTFNESLSSVGGHTSGGIRPVPYRSSDRCVQRFVVTRELLERHRGLNPRRRGLPHAKRPLQGSRVFGKGAVPGAIFGSR